MPLVVLIFHVVGKRKIGRFYFRKSFVMGVLASSEEGNFMKTLSALELTVARYKVGFVVDCFTCTCIGVAPLLNNLCWWSCSHNAIVKTIGSQGSTHSSYWTCWQGVQSFCGIFPLVYGRNAFRVKPVGGLWSRRRLSVQENILITPMSNEISNQSTNIRDYLTGILDLLIDFWTQTVDDSILVLIGRWLERQCTDIFSLLTIISVRALSLSNFQIFCWVLSISGVEDTSFRECLKSLTSLWV